MMTNRGNSKKFDKVDYIIIDEISMVKELFYRYFFYIKDNFPNVNFIIVGDFDQLAPVADVSNYDYNNSSILKEVCKFNKVNLSVCRRADDTLFNLCKSLNLKSYNFTSKVSMFNIVKTNRLRKQLNELCINRRISKNKIKNIVELKACPKYDNSQDIKLFKGLPLMGSITNMHFDIVNSEEYFCESFNEKTAIIKNKHDNKTREIPLEEVTKFLVPMYAVTVHKSQGITLRENYTIWQWERLDKRSKYVALSRSSDIKYINIRYDE